MSSGIRLNLTRNWVLVKYNWDIIMCSNYYWIDIFYLEKLGELVNLNINIINNIMFFHIINFFLYQKDVYNQINKNEISKIDTKLVLFVSKYSI